MFFFFLYLFFFVFIHHSTSATSATPGEGVTVAERPAASSKARQGSRSLVFHQRVSETVPAAVVVVKVPAAAGDARDCHTLLMTRWHCV